jgi:hypothetical protein
MTTATFDALFTVVANAVLDALLSESYNGAAVCLLRKKSLFTSELERFYGTNALQLLIGK